MHPLLSVINQKNDLRVQDVFDVTLYTATGAGLSVVNGINLATYGGFIWERVRNIASVAHSFIDNKRGITKYILPHSAAAEGTDSGYVGSFNTDGYTLLNSETAGRTIVANTFRIAPKFLDIVTYTGNGSSQNIAHSLGVTPGMIFVKRIDAARDWTVWHRSMANNRYLVLNSEAAQGTSTSPWDNTAPTSSVFSVGTNISTNAAAATYVAYIFAENSSLIQSGTYVGNGNVNGPTVNLGWDPQWVMVKALTNGGAGYRWAVLDSTRALGAGNDAFVSLNDTSPESGSYDLMALTGTGFQLKTSTFPMNESGTTFIYMAIRKE